MLTEAANFQVGTVQMLVNCGKYMSWVKELELLSSGNRGSVFHISWCVYVCVHTPFEKMKNQAFDF